jgi:hypothetical protein
MREHAVFTRWGDPHANAVRFSNPNPLVGSGGQRAELGKFEPRRALVVL